MLEANGLGGVPYHADPAPVSVWVMHRPLNHMLQHYYPEVDMDVGWGLGLGVTLQTELVLAHFTRTIAKPLHGEQLGRSIISGSSLYRFSLTLYEVFSAWRAGPLLGVGSGAPPVK